MGNNVKKIVGAIYLKNGRAMEGFGSDSVCDFDAVSEAERLSNSNADEIIVFDLSPAGDDKAHEESLDVIKDICKTVDVPVIGAGNVKRMEDIKKLLYAGCKRAALNFSKEGNIEILKEVSDKFGKEKIVVCYENADTVITNKDDVLSYASELVLVTKDQDKITDPGLGLPVMVVFDAKELPYKDHPEEMFFKYGFIDAVSGTNVNANAERINQIKDLLTSKGLKISALEPAFTWEQLKKNSDGMVPVIVQDYRTDQVLMLAYMNEEAYNNTLLTGKMTYYSRSRNELWVKGETSSHFQYVKSLTADCDLDTILAKVKQIGAACHTGSYSCFFNEIAKKDYSEKNPQKVLDAVYEVIKDRKDNPREGSYTNYLYEKGIDKILKKIGEEATEMVIAAKNPNENEVIYEMSDFLYHMMVLMAVKNVSWEDITDELSRR
ncbi:bifunctional phosphoribosyl-AMP cyclohydrolase/phosphoribosyl-ATP diphosphatase HisIE [Butyrivibrio sp. XPD2006]|uniref:bifunctional phosphoribosyl-AMP cyclohydrolase/phosphoribosyl-ATP diphosphatase HisIE n=1 Tax=Butyrivibrio sp. XPD2006 TaxID=1280668 RepID=UPI0003B6B1C5|nr:bifunctional phosphoribosyl-AMP cyclohydrolase/phosphoribosyl-ATP diphosphatase HisIE [Butyrivibrio sp. XPD2006]